MQRWLALIGATLLGLVALITWRSGEADADPGVLPPAPPPQLVATATLAPPAAAPPRAPVLREDELLVAPSGGYNPRTAEQKRLARYDKDNDRAVSQTEFVVYSRSAFNRRDLNQDGRLDFAEYAAARLTAFDQADVDDSGELNAAEFATTRTKSSTRKECPEPAQAETEA